MRDAQMQPLRELLAKKSKKNQMNPGNKACIPLESLGRIAAFQGVMANPNKKSPPLPRVVADQAKVANSCR
jgi:hypothetical protein